MNIKTESNIEKKLTITETDMVNGGEAIILIAYAIKENDDMWSYPAPQIFNSEVYEKNKIMYNNAVREFRLSCE